MFGSAYFCILGYILMKTRRELIAEKYYVKRSSKKWKQVLDISQDAIAICSSHKILYYNNSLRSLLNERKINTGPISVDVII